MRTTTAAASAVISSTPPLLPQPDSSEKTQHNVSEGSRATVENNVGESNIPRHSEHEQVSTASMFPMNAADMLVAYSSTVGLNINASSSIPGDGKPPMIHDPESAVETSCNATTAASVSSMLQAAGFGQQPSNLSESTLRLWKDLEDFIERGLRGVMAAQRGDPGAPSEETVAELQLQTARTLRQILPANRDLLHLVQEKNWMKMLLEWLNLHNRPAVQVEALLALTNIADLCQQSYHPQQTVGSTPLASANSGMNSFPQASSVGKGTESQQSLQADVQNCVSGQNPFMYPAFPWDYDRSQNTTVIQNDIASQTSVVEGYFPTFTNGIGATSTTESFAQYDDLELETRNSNNKKKSENTMKSEIVTGDVCSTDAESLTNRQPSKVNSKSFHFGAALHPATAVTSSQLNNTSYKNLSQPPVAISGVPPHMLSNLPVSLSQLPLTCDPNGKTRSGAPAPLTVGAPIPPTLVTAFNSSFSMPQQRLSMPPPPAVGSAPMVGTFPQPLSTSSQHMLLRHRDTIPTLVSLLSSPNREVHEQAMWILGSIVTSDSTSPPNNASSNASSLATSGSNGSVDMGDKISAKEAVLAAGVMTPLLSCLEANPHNLSLQRIGSWALSNLVETKIQQGKSNKVGGGSSNIVDNPVASEIEINLLLPTLRRLLNSSDHEVLSYTCWALSHLCDGPSSNIAAVVTSSDPRDVPGGLVPRLVDLLPHSSWKVTKPALRTIGNIVCAECGDDANNIKHGVNNNLTIPTDFTEVILDCEAVPRLKLLITHSNREIQKEACWTLSNIAAGTVDQIQAVIDSEAIPPLVKLVNDKNTDQEVRSEACWVVLNATSCGSDQQIEVLVAEGCVSVLGLLLEDASMVSMALEGLERVLQVEEHREATRRVRAQMRRNSNIDSDDDSEALPPSPLVNASLIKKALETHNSNAISKRAERIWNNHFVYCKLCRQSYSKHRTSDAKFCDECKCYVCSKCNCEIYHLSYQEELWAASEEKKEATKRAKKSKRQKRKEKRKEKNKTKQQEAKAAETLTTVCQAVQHIIPDNEKNQSQDQQISNYGNGMNTSVAPRSNYAETNHAIRGGGCTKRCGGKCAVEFKSQVLGMKDECVSIANIARPSVATKVKKKEVKQLPKNSFIVHADENAGTEEITCHKDLESDKNQPPVDFVLYLQQTGSIIALARLMDALDDGNGLTYEGDTDIDRLSALKPQSTTI